MKNVVIFPGDPRVLVSAPHGHDYHTAEIAREVCRLTKFAGLAIPHVEDPQTGLRVNVNRPSEGAGLTVDEERRTELAEKTYQKYLGFINKICEGSPPIIYVEIHGNETQTHCEVACIRIPMYARHALKRAIKDIPGGALVDGLDRIVLDADQSQQIGLLRFIPMALHFELCSLARELEDDRLRSAESIALGIFSCLAGLE